MRIAHEPSGNDGYNVYVRAVEVRMAEPVDATAETTHPIGCLYA